MFPPSQYDTLLVITQVQYGRIYSHLTQYDMVVCGYFNQYDMAELATRLLMARTARRMPVGSPVVD